MSQIAGILAKLENTSVYETLVKMEEAYQRIEAEQDEWYEKCRFNCPSGCGSCCHGFEPDILECEVLYMAAWLLENQPFVAEQVAHGFFPFQSQDGTCPFFNPNSPFHCSIYFGRAFICRLFGASSYHSRDGQRLWRPCKFYPEEYLASHQPPLEKRQYTQEETEKVLGALPPLMSDLVESARSLGSDRTYLIHEILPQTICRLQWLMDMNDNDNPNGTPSPLAA